MPDGYHHGARAAEINDTWPTVTTIILPIDDVMFAASSRRASTHDQRSGNLHHRRAVHRSTESFAGKKIINLCRVASHLLRKVVTLKCHHCKHVACTHTCRK